MQEENLSVRVVTDSAADLPSDVIKKLGIAVVPLRVHFGEEVYLDGVDLTPEEFFRKMTAGAVLPTTSLPSVGTFAETYRKLADGADGIVSIHLSASLSGTYNAARLGSEEAQASCPIRVFDTLTVSLAQGLIVMAAAEAAQEGASLEEVFSLVEDAISRARVVFTLDTLEYLYKGGRIGKAQAFLGSLLSIKPVLRVQNGEILPVERARSKAQAVERLCQMVEGLPHIERLAVAHSTDVREVESLLERLSAICPRERILVRRFGATVGTYTGPGAVGIALLEGKA